MKKLLCSLLACAFFSCSLGYAADISAAELAQHLGISVWRISQAKLPKSYVACIKLVDHGRVISDMAPGAYGGWSLPFSSSNGDLVICSHSDNGRMFVTLANKYEVWSPIEGSAMAPFSVKHEIGSQPAVGEHLLCAFYVQTNPHEVYTATGSIKDAIRGLVLVVLPASAPR